MSVTRHRSHAAESKPGVEMRPKLAFVYHPRSIPALSIVEAARDLCDLVWVIDSSQPDLGATARLLSRFGALVDIAGSQTTTSRGPLRSQSNWHCHFIHRRSRAASPTSFTNVRRCGPAHWRCPDSG